MTPQEIKAAVVALKQEIGPSAYVDGTISSSKYRDATITFVLYPEGIGGARSDPISVHAETWEDGIEALRVTWAESAERHYTALIRKMALGIIRITAEQGACTDAALRADDFTAEEVDRFGEAAIVDANSIAQNGPFSIQKLAGANAA